jgi:RNA recognition motif-containing protein
VKNCEVIRDQKTGDSLQYAFVEFYDQPACEQAYFKMDNVLIGGLIHRIKRWETHRLDLELDYFKMDNVLIGGLIHRI